MAAIRRIEIAVVTKPSAALPLARLGDPISMPRQDAFPGCEYHGADRAGFLKRTSSARSSQRLAMNWDPLVPWLVSAPLGFLYSRDSAVQIRHVDVGCVRVSIRQRENLRMPSPTGVLRA